MNRVKIGVCLLLFSFVVLPYESHAQIDKLTKDLMSVIKAGDEPKSGIDSVKRADSLRNSDSLKIAELQEMVQQMKLNEILMLQGVAQNNKDSELSDSIKLARRKERIDSLRVHTPGSPVIVESDTLFRLYAKQGGISLNDRAKHVAEVITELGEMRKVKPDSIKLTTFEDMTEIYLDDKIILSVSDNDGMWMNMSRDSLAQQYHGIIVEKVKQLQKEHSTLQLMKRVLYFILIIVVQYLLFRLTTYLFRRLKRKIIGFSKQKLHTISIKEIEFLTVERQAHLMIFLSNLLRYAIIGLQLIFSIPMLFSIFPQTEALAHQIFQYIMSPIKQVLISVIKYIPNIFYIIIIWLCIRYLIRGVKYLANEIESERLKINGFYPDWAQPSYNIVRALLYAFMVAMMWPYLPGSGSQIFQGVSVFIGLIISLGSSSVIGNMMAGLVMTYMRPFKLGDRIKLNDTIGNVVEKTPFVTRIVTPKNEIITIPNSFMMSSHTINYSDSARTRGLIIHTTVTIGYEVDWRIVHNLLIKAAEETEGVTDEFKPFVLDTSFESFFPVYQINAFIRDADQMTSISARLHQNIQDRFREAGVELATPSMYMSIPAPTELLTEKDFLERQKMRKNES